MDERSAHRSVKNFSLFHFEGLRGRTFKSTLFFYLVVIMIVVPVGIFFENKLGIVGSLLAGFFFAFAVFYITHAIEKFIQKQPEASPFAVVLADLRLSPDGWAVIFKWAFGIFAILLLFILQFQELPESPSVGIETIPKRLLFVLGLFATALTLIYSLLKLNKQMVSLKPKKKKKKIKKLKKKHKKPSRRRNSP
jgi:hypothetical protein